MIAGAVGFDRESRQHIATDVGRVGSTTSDLKEVLALRALAAHVAQLGPRAP